jgi:hypothetical protein
LTVFGVFATLTVYAAFSTITPKTKTLKVEFVISASKTAWDYVIDRIAFETARLTCHLIAVKDSLPDFAPTCSASSVPQCACH